MDCILSSPLSDDELFAALDDRATAETLKHLAQCEYCAAKLERIRKFEQSIHVVMHRVDCPSNEALADYLMSGTANQQIEQHLETCVRCQEEASLLRAVFTEVPSNHRPVTESIWQKAKGFFQSVEEQFIQVLLPQPTLAYGQLKGDEKHNNRVLSFAVGAVSVMLSLEKIADGLKINGTIVDTESDDKWREANVELTGAQRRYLGTVDDLETFTFDYILPGTFSLSIYAVGGQVLRLPRVELVP